ncbi:TlpA disulfide reductase family protein [Christiangramia echinicola]|uniref:Thiol-disulfide isomerase or thioredoxin n=1 Tax=Christiangramia echinicola TaxID=279359 RepID=A0A1H1QV28_9FLAO|nr:TlpA disulfide reductase family protein [Christiangramia echinicola]SDS27304.1 Thiol-disulfide isomerase or thioredoxin [Christiangramia echinicola]
MMKGISIYSQFYNLLFAVFLISAIGCQNKKTPKNDGVASKLNGSTITEDSKKANPSFYAEGIPVYEKFKDMEPMLNVKNDTTYVVNFWATWCKPCIKEIPYFKELDSTYKDQKVKLVLVSLDFPKDVKTKLVSFAKEQQIESNVVVLLDGKYNDWIDKVSPHWSGAIPATYVFNRKRKELFQRTFESTEELIDIVEPFL